MKKKLWVIIPFYLDSVALARCLDALRQSTFKDIEIFIRDNSIDNIYFTAAVNEGFKAGLADPDVSDFLVLNQDCYLEPAALEVLYSHLALSPVCGIACPLQLDENRNVTWGGSTQAFPLGKHLSLALDQYEKPFPTYWANGACMWVRRAVVEEIGFFDKNFQFICSDSDYSFTARTRGWEIHVVPDARSEHELSGSAKNASAALNLIKAQDVIYFYEKWLSGDVFRRISHEGATLVKDDMENLVQGLRAVVETARLRAQAVNK